MEPKYKLFIQKYVDFCDNNHTISMSFCLIDANKGVYPKSWICNFPRRVLYSKNFTEIFKNCDRLAFAIELLETAKNENADVDILAEIKRRIKILTPKIRTLTACRACGSSFLPKNVIEAFKDGLLKMNNYVMWRSF
jgi:hypothetical protein